MGDDEETGENVAEHWGDTADLVALRPRLSVEQKAYLARVIFSEMLHLQERKVAHLDIKLYNFTEVNGRPLLGDFGSGVPFDRKLPDVLADCGVDRE
ncbi:hypothetical protein Esti_002267 [Eimeria stiedai]